MSLLAELMHVASLISLVVLCALGLRKLVRMDGLHGLRVVIFTMLLWAVALYLFSLAWPMSPVSPEYHCVPDNDEAPCFTISEM